MCWRNHRGDPLITVLVKQYQNTNSVSLSLLLSIVITCVGEEVIKCHFIELFENLKVQELAEQATWT